MKMHSGLFVAFTASFAFAVACADSGNGGDDGSGSNGNQDVCGDGVCAAAEVGVCTNDCGNGNQGSGSGAWVCGNAMCETSLGESSANCFSDCGGQGSGSGSGSGSATNCPADLTECLCVFVDPSTCPAGIDQETCLSCLGLGSGGGSGSDFGDIFCEGMAADGVCNAAAGEDVDTCPSDCM